MAKKVAYKAAETRREFIRNKIADAVAKLYDNKIVKLKLCLRKIQKMLRKQSFHQKKEKKYRVT